MVAQAGSGDLELRVANGEPVEECGFPTVVSTGRCTATLVHPQIVLYASHCGKSRSISFMHKNGTGRKVTPSECKTYPGGGGNSAKDFAYCKLEEPVTDFPIVPVAFGCELDMVKEGLDIVHCGFGATESGGYSGKNWGANKLRSLQENGDGTGVLETRPSPVNSCSGDSGGPLLVQLKDGSWRTIGIAATISGKCGGSNVYNRYAYAPGAVEWVEKESGIDITPCFNLDGEWEPTKECGKFFAGGAEGHGTWDNGCEGTPRSGFSSTCGPAFGGGEGGEDESDDNDADEEKSDEGEAEDANSEEKKEEEEEKEKSQGEEEESEEEDEDDDEGSTLDCSVSATQGLGAGFFGLLALISIGRARRARTRS